MVAFRKYKVAGGKPDMELFAAAETFPGSTACVNVAFPR